ncbi:MAG: fibronectin type III domain-containing protein [Actinobacteria bacterium]|nr:fibronectin type III domain-containing protein [Actinomycetota bacterium]
MFTRLKRWAVPAVLAVLTAGVAACEPATNVQGTLVGTNYTVTWDDPDCLSEGSCAYYTFDYAFLLDVTPGHPIASKGTPCLIAVTEPNTCTIDVSQVPAGDYIVSHVAWYADPGASGGTTPPWYSRWLDDGLTAESVEAMYACWTPQDPAAFANSGLGPYSGGWVLTQSGCSVGSWTFGASIRLDASGSVTETTGQSASATVPGAPTDVAAVAGDGSAAVSWSAPASDGGAAITGYTVTSSPGGATCATTGETTCEVSGLDNFTGYTFTVTATNSAGTSMSSDASNTVVPYSGEFQVWLPKPVVAREGDTQVWVFGATGVDTVKVRIGLEVLEVSPDASGIAIADYTMGTASALTHVGRLRVTASAVRVAEDGSKEKLRASALLYSPSTTLRKKWREGSQVTVRVRSAGEASALSFRIDGVEVCATDADDRGRASCAFDAPTEGGYTLQTYVGDQLTGENDFVVTTWGRRVD